MRGVPWWGVVPWSEPALAASREVEPELTLAPTGGPTLEELYGQYANFVYRSLRALGVPNAQADDALQEVFIVAQRHLGQFRGPYFKAWLFRLASSVASNARRSAKRAGSRASSVDPEMLAADAQEPFESAVQAERVRVLDGLLADLDAEKREVFILAELEQLSQVEIAEALGVHINTVAYRLKKAKAELELGLKKFHLERRAVLTPEAP